MNLKCFEQLELALYRIEHKMETTIENDVSSSDIALIASHLLPEYKKGEKDRVHKRFHIYSFHTSAEEYSEKTKQDMLVLNYSESKVLNM